MPEPDDARIAYDAYVAFHARRGTTVVPAAWQDLLFDEQHAWGFAIAAAMNAQRPGDAP